MNALKTFPESQKAKILHHGMIYEFRLTDIANIWIKSLTQSVTFSPQPVMPKNPYLNMSFNKGHLFHFYMCMKDIGLSQYCTIFSLRGVSMYFEYLCLILLF